MSPRRPGGSRRIALGVGGVVVLLAAIDAYVVVTVLVTMVGDLGVPVNHIEHASLVVTAFLLGYVAGMPLLGMLSDRFGRQVMVQACLAGFAAGSAVTALAGSLPVLIAGRGIQGLAGGALLPITMALAGDLWEERRRPAVLGAVGALQELGSVLGPLYGAGVAALVGWRGIFWINIPVTLLAMAAVWWAVPRGRPAAPTRVDVIGGLLLAAGLGLLVAGLYNPDPQRSALPSWGVPCVAAGAVVIVAFAGWEARARTRLLDLRGARRGGLFAVLGVSLLSGAALMITLVDVQLIAQTLLGRTSTGGAFLLARFLIPLAVAALAGGLVARRCAERWIVAGGMLVAACGYARIAAWPVRSEGLHYDLGVFAVSRVGVDLAVAGLGLGLVIAPLSSVALRSVPAVRHGVASAAVVVARMMGMLLGVAGLSAWGFFRFHALTAHLVTPLPIGVSQAEFTRRMATYLAAVKAALHTEYADVFWATAGVCVLAAVLGLAVGGSTPAAVGEEPAEGPSVPVRAEPPSA
ncbi:MFS transporter [Actinoallomurus soli]|uniref:MFS transporter n=1 Tax=Actinoallomurus soli TaxID=2952535 RepID=UPI0020922D13|nr:MFS transporter [Actinoallomurus soli]MCO5973112.1 MFS transporter [Actinoallomurus soli]